MFFYSHSKSEKKTFDQMLIKVNCFFQHILIISWSVIYKLFKNYNKIPGIFLKMFWKKMSKPNISSWNIKGICKKSVRSHFLYSDSKKNWDGLTYWPISAYSSCVLCNCLINGRNCLVEKWFFDCDVICASCVWSLSQVHPLSIKWKIWSRHQWCILWHILNIDVELGPIKYAQYHL